MIRQLIFLLFTQQKEIINKISVFEENDLYSEETFMIYLYYEKPGFTCLTCEYFEDYVSKIPMPLKRLNFCTNVILGSKFLSLKFPVLIIRHRRKSYVIEPTSGEDLIDILENKKWIATGPVKWYLETDSKIARIFSIFNAFIFYVISKSYYVIDYVPDSVVSGFIIIVITYLIYSIVEIFREPDEKIKLD